MAHLERTEDQQVGMLPIVARFGAKDYNIAPLTINRAREWRAKLIGDVTSAAAALSGDGGLTTRFLEGLKGCLLVFPEKVAEFVFAYAPDLPAEDILNEASEEQLAVAFSQIMGVAFPFTRQLQAIQQVIKEFGNLSR